MRVQRWLVGAIACVLPCDTRKHLQTPALEPGYDA
jgi:hypothetical protein